LETQNDIQTIGLQALKLDAKELKQREIVNIDIVKDAVDTADYKKEEDPAVFKSEKTGRGPLSKANWMVCWLVARSWLGRGPSMWRFFWMVCWLVARS
jgi:hypothetical protein